MDFSELLEQLIERFEEAREAEEDAQREQSRLVGSRYEAYTQHIRRVKAWYEGKLRAMQMQQGEDGGMRAQGGREQYQDVDVCGVVGRSARQVGRDGSREDFLMPEVMERMDDAYWHDFLAEWASL